MKSKETLLNDFIKSLIKILIKVPLQRKIILYGIYISGDLDKYKNNTYIEEDNNVFVIF